MTLPRVRIIYFEYEMKNDIHVKIHMVNRIEYASHFIIHQYQARWIMESYINSVKVHVELYFCSVYFGLAYLVIS